MDDIVGEKFGASNTLGVVTGFHSSGVKFFGKVQPLCPKALRGLEK